MKRFFPTSLALLLVIGSLGNVLAAALCPRMLGHDCCLARTSGEPPAQSHQHIHGLAVVGMSDEGMSMYNHEMHDMVMDNDNVPPVSTTDKASQISHSEEFVSSNNLELPLESCTHCMSHSGVLNAPISSASVADSNKDFGSVPLPVSRFLVRPLTLAQIGLPREHAPPDASAPRNILFSVFLI